MTNLQASDYIGIEMTKIKVLSLTFEIHCSILLSWATAIIKWFCC